MAAPVTPNELFDQVESILRRASTAWVAQEAILRLCGVNQIVDPMTFDEMWREYSGATTSYHMCGIHTLHAAKACLVSAFVRKPFVVPAAPVPAPTPTPIVNGWTRGRTSTPTPPIVNGWTRGRS